MGNLPRKKKREITHDRSMDYHSRRSFQSWGLRGIKRNKLWCFSVRKISQREVLNSKREGPNMTGITEKRSNAGRAGKRLQLPFVTSHTLVQKMESYI